MSRDTILVGPVACRGLDVTISIPQDNANAPLESASIFTAPGVTLTSD